MSDDQRAPWDRAVSLGCALIVVLPFIAGVVLAVVLVVR